MLAGGGSGFGPGGGLGGGLGVLGALIFPASIVLRVLQQRGPVAKLRAIGAISERTARRPRSAELSMYDDVDRLRRRGLVRATEDGRLWVDEAGVARWRRRMLALAVGLAVLVVAAAIAVVVFR